jgi:hypothetical protein
VFPYGPKCVEKLSKLHSDLHYYLTIRQMVMVKQQSKILSDKYESPTALVKGRRAGKANRAHLGLMLRYASKFAWSSLANAPESAMIWLSCNVHQSTSPPHRGNGEEEKVTTQVLSGFFDHLGHEGAEERHGDEEEDDAEHLPQARRV